MKEKIKKIIFGYLPGFITGLIICGSISVIAATYFPSNDVTYDNTKSGLTSTNVQGAIDELYGVCTAESPAGEQIIEDAGLEKDPYECRYFFTGASPNNYITFNDEQAGWRIISVECDGTIKIIHIEKITNLLWGTPNDWARPSTLNTHLNSTYYNELNTTAQSQIVVKDFSIGAVDEQDTILENTINNENSKKWSGKIALPTVSEYIRSNSDTEDCGAMNQYTGLTNACGNTTWMYKKPTWWTLTPYLGNDSQVYALNETFGTLSPYPSSTNMFDVRPALYLSSDIKLTGGTGTSSDPYQIS